MPPRHRLSSPCDPIGLTIPALPPPGPYSPKSAAVNMEALYSASSACSGSASASPRGPVARSPFGVPPKGDGPLGGGRLALSRGQTRTSRPPRPRAGGTRGARRPFAGEAALAPNGDQDDSARPLRGHARRRRSGGHAHPRFAALAPKVLAPLRRTACLGGPRAAAGLAVHCDDSSSARGPRPVRSAARRRRPHSTRAAAVALMATLQARGNRHAR